MPRFQLSSTYKSSTINAACEQTFFFVQLLEDIFIASQDQVFVCMLIGTHLLLNNQKRATDENKLGAKTYHCPDV